MAQQLANCAQASGDNAPIRVEVVSKEGAEPSSSETALMPRAPCSKSTDLVTRNHAHQCAS